MKKPKKYSGAVVPMVTPFTASGDIDIPSARKVVEHIVTGGCSPFVLGTTGEAASVPIHGRGQFVKAMVEQTRGRSMTYAGIAGNCFAESADSAKAYFDLGVDCVVANLPSYYQINADQMLRYYEKLADAVGGPLMLYNITITTHMSIPLEVVEKLSRHQNIVGLKDSERNEERMVESLKLWKDRDDFAHLMGCAALSAKALLLGSDGIVPSTGNFVPRMFRQLYDAATKGDIAVAEKLQAQTDEMAKIYQGKRLLSESLAALKVMMSELGLCGPAVLPPLIECSKAEKATIREEMTKLGVRACAYPV
ncbi:MAG TPA: dihydrodipicolinate synthase family protein [Sedimentisphaerales bacterium]|nr:dihydrodipicolinate synthase family protein [Sedimentisphaerales bacterium]